MHVSGETELSKGPTSECICFTTKRSELLSLCCFEEAFGKFLRLLKNSFEVGLARSGLFFNFRFQNSFDRNFNASQPIFDFACASQTPQTSQLATDWYALRLLLLRENSSFYLYF